MRGLGFGLVLLGEACPCRVGASLAEDGTHLTRPGYEVVAEALRSP